MLVRVSDWRQALKNRFRVDILPNVSGISFLLLVLSWSREFPLPHTLLLLQFPRQGDAEVSVDWRTVQLCMALDIFH